MLNIHREQSVGILSVNSLLVMPVGEGSASPLPASQNTHFIKSHPTLISVYPSQSAEKAHKQDIQGDHFVKGKQQAAFSYMKCMQEFYRCNNDELRGNTPH